MIQRGRRVRAGPLRALGAPYALGVQPSFLRGELVQTLHLWGS